VLVDLAISKSSSLVAARLFDLFGDGQRHAEGVTAHPFRSTGSAITILMPPMMCAKIMRVRSVPDRPLMAC